MEFPGVTVMPVTIAPSTRAKLLHITTRDLHPPLHDPFKNQDFGGDPHLSHHSSAFVWAVLDSNSDSECEDLGDAEALHPTVSSSPAPSQRAPAGVAPSATVLPSARSPATPPRRAKPPWKSLWKGPLPHARLSPLATLGYFLPPAFRSAGGRGAAGATDAVLDPVPMPVQILENRNHRDPVQAHQNQAGALTDSVSGTLPILRSHTPPVPSSSPPPGTSSTPRCRRRLVNATVPLHLLSTTPYRNALMAGRGRFRRRGLEGRGATAHPQAAGDQADQTRRHGVPRGRGAVAQPLGDGDRKPTGERGMSAWGAEPGRGRSRGARDNVAG
jgi:hypothetical protein